VVADLLRAGPAATRNALREDDTLAGFLDPADYARLAEYATPHPAPATKVKARGDALTPPRTTHRRAAMAGVRLFVSITLAAAIAWLTYRGVLHAVR